MPHADYYACAIIALPRRRHYFLLHFLIYIMMPLLRCRAADADFRALIMLR